MGHWRDTFSQQMRIIINALDEAFLLTRLLRNLKTLPLPFP